MKTAWFDIIRLGGTTILPKFTRHKKRDQIAAKREAIGRVPIKLKRPDALYASQWLKRYYHRQVAHRPYRPRQHVHSPYPHGRTFTSHRHNLKFPKRTTTTVPTTFIPCLYAAYARNISSRRQNYWRVFTPFVKSKSGVKKVTCSHAFMRIQSKDFSAKSNFINFNKNFCIEDIIFWIHRCHYSI